jgi:minor fimbrial subunit
VALDLSNCPVGTSRVTASFSGTADATGYYKNQGTAGNIQLELQDDGGTTLNNGAAKRYRSTMPRSPPASRCRSER